MIEIQRPSRAQDHTALVTVPAEIDIADAEGIGEQMAAASTAA